MLQRLLFLLGFGLCHQLPERSFIAGGLQAPVCARDTGIYVGFAVGFALLTLLHQDRPRGLPPRHVWIVSALWLALMAWDGITSYSGLRETVNGIRLISGLGVGFSAAALILPMLNDEVWRESSAARVLEPAWRFWTWLLAIPLTWALMTYLGPLLGAAWILAIALSVPVTLTLINLVIIAILPAFDRKGMGPADVLLPLTLAFALSVAEIAGSGVLRWLLIGWAAGR